MSTAPTILARTYRTNPAALVPTVVWTIRVEDRLTGLWAWAESDAGDIYGPGRPLTAESTERFLAPWAAHLCTFDLVHERGALTPLPTKMAA